MLCIKYERGRIEGKKNAQAENVDGKNIGHKAKSFEISAVCQHTHIPPNQASQRNSTNKKKQFVFDCCCCCWCCCCSGTYY